MHGTVAEFMVAEHAATGNDHLELVGLVEVRPGYGAWTLLDQEGHRVQRIVGRWLLVWRQGVAVGADIGGVPAGRGLAPAGAAGEDAVGGQDHGVLRLLSACSTAARHDARCHSPSHTIAEQFSLNQPRQLDAMAGRTTPCSSCHRAHCSGMAHVYFQLRYHGMSPWVRASTEVRLP